jgi:hypothetical protein
VSYSGRIYATFNPLDKAASVTLSSGNLVASAASAGAVRATIGKSSGKWYWEITTTGAVTGGSRGLGTAAATLANYPGFDANGCEYDKNGRFYSSNFGSPYGTAFTTETIGIALDKDANTVIFYLNGVAQPLKALPVALAAGTVFPMVGAGGGIHTYTANFGATAFASAIPAGFNGGVFI